MLTQTLYTAAGHTAWVKLRELVGAPLPPEIANAEPKTKRGHDVRDCATQTECPQHATHFIGRLMTEAPVPQEG